MSDVTISERYAGSVTILTCNGKFTIGEGSVTLRNAVRDLIGRNRNKILLNLGGLSYVDSSGIGELVSSFAAVKKEGGVIKLLALTQKVQDTLAATRLITVFDVFDKEDEAVASFE